MQDLHQYLEEILTEHIS